MTQVRCSDKKKQNTTLNLLGFSLKKNIGFAFIATVILGIICMSIALDGINAQWDGHDLRSTLRLFAIFTIIVSGGTATVLSIANFNYMFSKPATDMFHSLPISHAKLLLTRAASTFVGSLIPYTAGYVIFAFVSMPAWKNASGIAGSFFDVYGEGILLLLVYTAILTLHAAFAGNAVGYLSVIAATQIGVPLFIFVIVCFAERYLTGYTISDGTLNTATCFSVMARGIYLYGERVISLTFAKQIIPTLAIILAVPVSAVLFYLAVIVYRMRRSESAGLAFSFRIAKYFTALILSVAVGHCLGMFFSLINSDSVYWIFAVAGTVLAAIVIFTVVDKGFSTIKHALVCAGVSIAILVTTSSGVLIYSDSYNNYIPKVNDITHVSININGTTLDFNDNFNLITDIHKTAITPEDDNYYEIGTKKFVPLGYSFLDGYSNMEITYTLKNGKTVKRLYESFDAMYNAPLLKIMQSKEYADKLTKSLTSRFSDINVELNQGGGYDNCSYRIEDPKTEMAPIISAYLSDLDVLSAEDLKNAIKGNGYDEIIYISSWDSANNYFHIRIPVCDEFKNTCDELSKVMKVTVNNDSPTDDGGKVAEDIELY